jgi:DNA-directed RNA polymerase subunit RPC12/RpoP
MIPSLTIRCPACDARIKAPLQLIGQWRACPGCGCRFVIQPQVPDEEGPILVGDEPPASFASTSGSLR